MKIILITFLLLMSTLLNADELYNAYQKEFTFLKAQKSELQKRTAKEKSFQTKELAKAKAKVQRLQNRLVELSQTNQNIQKQIEKSSVMLDDKRSNKEISASVLIQASSLLSDYKIHVDSSKNADIIAVMNQAFSDATTLYTKLSSRTTEDGKFYLVDLSLIHI